MSILSKILSVCLTIPIGALSFLLGTFSLSEHYNLFDPEIDTQYPIGYSKEKYYLLHEGMDTSSVLKIVGQPFFKQKQFDGNINDQIWYYSSDGACKCWDFAWIEKYLIIDSNGKVKLKAETIAFD